MALGYVATLDASPFMGGLRAMQGGLGGMGKMLGPLAALAGAFAGVATAGAALKRSISEAAEMEEMQTNFVTLLGSTSAAQARMEELADFAGSTPFDLPGVAQASKTLETLTRGALSTGDGLRLVGDVASGTGVGFAEMSTTVGRLYDGLKSGRAVGESMARLQELGVITGDTRAKLEAMQAAGEKGDKVWDVAAAALGRFSGNMERQSKTWKGMMSNLEDGIGAVFREFGQPLMDNLKPALAGLASVVDDLAPKAKAFGTMLGSAIGTLINAFKQGAIGELAGMALQLGFAKAVNFLTTGLRGVSAFVGELLAAIPEQLSAAFKVVTNPSLWEGLKLVLSSVASGFITALATGMAPLVDKLLGLLRKMGMSIDFNAEEMADAAAAQSMEQWEEGAAKLKGALDPLMTSTADTLGNALAAAEKAVADAPEFMKTGPLVAAITTLTDSLKPVAAAVADSAGAGAGAGAGTEGDAAAPGKGGKSGVEADAYARLGLFVGGAGSGLTSETREVRRGVEKLKTALVSKLDRVIEKLGPQSATGAAWA